MTACVYHGVNRVFLGRHCFEFTTRQQSLQSLLAGAMDPVKFMCEALRISPLQDLNSLDECLASSFQRNIPEGFSLLGVDWNPGWEIHCSYNSLLAVAFRGSQPCFPRGRITGISTPAVISTLTQRLLHKVTNSNAVLLARPHVR